MRRFFILPVALATLPFPALGQDCVDGAIAGIDGTCSGDVVFTPRELDPNVDGDRLNVAAFDLGLTGTYTLGPGETLLLEGLDNDAVIGGDKRPRITVGFGPATDGTLTIDGGRIDMISDGGSPSVKVGEDGGSGALNIINGGVLTMTDLGVLERNADAGERGAFLNVGTGTLDGNLTLDNGAIEMLSSLSSRVSIGTSDVAGGVGTAVLSNGSRIVLQQQDVPGGTAENTFLIVGDFDGSNGSLSVFDSTIDVLTDSGRATIGIGSFGDAHGNLLLSGAGTEVTIRGSQADFTVGQQASGQVDMENGASLVVDSTDPSARTDFRLGFQGASSNAVMNMSGGSTVTVGGPTGGAGRASIGDGDPEAGENIAGFLNLTDAGTLFAATESIRLGSFGDGGGTSVGVVTVSDGAELRAPEIRVGDGGILRGDGGTITGDVVVEDGGSVAPGLSPGIMTIDGDLDLFAGSILDIEFEGTAPGEFDLINVLGDVNSDGMFNLVLSFVDFTPVEDTVLSFLNVGGTLDTGFFANAMIEVVGLGAGSEFSFVETDGMLGIRADTIAPIPLPAGGVLLMSALGGLALAKRRRKGAA